MSKKQLFKRFITANQEGNFFESKIRRAIIINLFSLVGIFSLIYFLTGGLLHHKVTYSIIIIIFLIFTTSNLIIFQIKKYFTLASIVVVSLMFLLELALFMKLGESTTGLFWFYLFPMLAFFILGRKGGTYFVIALLIIVIAMFKYPIENLTVYPDILHERFIFTYITTSILAYIFENVRGSTFKAFVEADKQKTSYLEEVLQQKEELQTQSEILENKNLALLKLNMAVSKTENSIIICDSETKIEWVNKGFENTYGYTLKEIHEKCSSLYECSENKEDIDKCREEKTSVTYHSNFTSKDGSIIWIQSTISPILDDKEEIINFVIVESDYTQLKRAEQEIIEKNTELEQQRDEILAQKEELSSKTEIILQKNEAIQKSIEYGLTIQNSILPNLNDFKQFYNCFIIYRPKDIVSGDFYWYKKYNNEYYSAVVDCTGHGVPGAFMSILGSMFLNQILMMRGYTSPAKILKELNSSINKILQQNNTQNRDGMDLSIVKFPNSDDEIKTVIFSGAKRPLIYFDKIKNQIVVLKGTRKGIGGIESKYNQEEYIDNEIKLKKGSILYLTSDGYIDQHNKKRKRIGSNNLFKLLDNLKNDKMGLQKEVMIEFLDDWQGEQEQTDDITIWGIKI